jgi:hypothetical protein
MARAMKELLFNLTLYTLCCTAIVGGAVLFQQQETGMTVAQMTEPARAH